MNYEAFYEDVLAYSVRKSVHDQVALARDIFFQYTQNGDGIGFDEWYVFSYQMPETPMHLYLEAHPEVDSFGVERSFRSYFEVSIQRGNVFFKDLFTGEDFKVSGRFESSDAIVSARLVEVPKEGTYAILGEVYVFESHYKDVVKRHVLEQYNRFVEAYEPVSMRTFLLREGHVLYSALNVIERIVNEEAGEEAMMMLYQSSYAFKGTVEELVDLLAMLPYKIVSDEEETDVLKVFHNEVVLAEVEIALPKVYVLCNSESHGAEMKKSMESIEGERLVYLTSETLTMDDIILQLDDRC